MSWTLPSDCSGYSVALWGPIFGGVPEGKLHTFPKCHPDLLPLPNLLFCFLPYLSLLFPTPFLICFMPHKKRLPKLPLIWLPATGPVLLLLGGHPEPQMPKLASLNLSKQSLAAIIWFTVFSSQSPKKGPASLIPPDLSSWKEDH